MSRSRLFKIIRKCMRFAHQANKKGLTDQEVLDLLKQQQNSPKSSQESARRRFLKQTSAAAAGAAAMSLPWPVTAAMAAVQEPVLIIGGGAAGLAAAYQLRKAGVPFRICDAGYRLGGRIHTARNFNTSGQFVELGAELVDTNHYTLRGIAEELGVEIEDFTASDQGVTREVFYFNNQAYTEAEFIVGVRPLIEKISAASDEIYGEADEYISAKSLSVMPNAAKYDNMSIRQYLDANSEGVEPWVMEAINVAYLCEYGMETEEQTSINLIDFIDKDMTDGFDMFGDSDESKRIKGGNDGLITAIINHLKLDEKNHILNARLKSIKEGKDNKLTCTFDYKGKAYKMSASHVICTIPFSVLREVEGLKQGSELLADVQPEKITCINELGYGSNTKMMMSFKTRFWRQKTKKMPANTGSLYSDLTSQTFWETSRLQNGPAGILTNFTGGQRGLAIAKSVGDKRGKDEATVALKDLSEAYGEAVKDLHDGKVAIMPWPVLPQTKGSYSCPKVGQMTSIWGYNADPECNNRLFFAGEHTHPLTYGFMNGAYSSGCRAAAEVLEQLKIEAPEIPGRKLVPEGAEDGDN